MTLCVVVITAQNCTSPINTVFDSDILCQASVSLVVTAAQKSLFWQPSNLPPRD